MKHIWSQWSWRQFQPVHLRISSVAELDIPICQDTTYSRRDEAEVVEAGDYIVDATHGLCLAGVSPES